MVVCVYWKVIFFLISYQQFYSSIAELFDQILNYDDENYVKVIFCSLYFETFAHKVV